MKITIIGYSGGGKTTLARRISEHFHIPHQQIDRIWFGAGGHKAKTEAEKERVRQIILEKVTSFTETNSNWVSDGFYRRAQGILASQADYVVVLELPLWCRLLNHWKRILHKQDRHPEVTPWQDFLHSFTIIKRTVTFKPMLESFKKEYADKLVFLRNHREIDVFFEKLTVSN